MLTLSATEMIKKSQDLPPGLRARRQSSGAIYFYLKTEPTQKELPLGEDREAALREWHSHRLRPYLDGCVPVSVLTLLESFRLAEIPLRSPKSRPTLLRQTAALENFFKLAGSPALIAPWPDTNAYYRFRGSRFEIRAGAELRLFIHVWGWARRLSLVGNEHVCRWTPDPVAVRIRRDVLREVADALLAIASRVGLPLHDSPPSGDQFASKAHSHGRAIGSSRIAARFPLLVSTTQTEIIDHASIVGIEASTFLRDAAKQLAADGRQDLAREVRRLSSSELQEVLKLVYESTGDMPSGGRMVLGMQRSIQLDAIKRTRRTKARPERALVSNGARTNQLAKAIDQ